MTELSYQHNVQRQVTGDWSATCLLASWDRISQWACVSPQLYEAYNALRWRFVEECGDDALYIPQHLGKDWRALAEQIQVELGAPTPRNVFSVKVDTYAELGDCLNRLMDGGFRTCVYLDTNGLHAVGLIRLDPWNFVARSTWSPFENDNCVGLDEINEYLFRSPRLRKRPDSSRKTYKHVNVVALPPERSR